MSKTTSFILAGSLLLLAAALLVIGLNATPPGLNLNEAQDVQIADYIRVGQVDVLYEINGGGREGFYHILLSVLTTFIGNRVFGYRMVSVWVNLVALSLTYTLTRRLYGRVIGLIALAAMIVPMGSILLFRTIARETMLPLILVGLLMVIARALPVYRQPNLKVSTIPFGVLGLVLGIGFYVHPSHYFIVLLVPVFIGYMILTRQRMSRRTLSYLIFSLVIALIVATPYLISSLRTPELNGIARFDDAYHQIIEQGIFSTILNSFQGLFLRGDANLQHNLPLRPFFDPITFAVIILGIVFAVRHIMQPRYALPLIAFFLLIPILIFTPASPNFMAYPVLLPLFALFFGLGVKQLQQIVPSGRLLMGGVMLLLVVNLGWSFISLDMWGKREDVRAAYHERIYELATYLDETVDDTATVVCVPVLPNLPTWAFAVNQPATLLALMMDNPNENQIRYTQCESGVVFTNGGDHQQVILLEENMMAQFHPYIQNWLSQGDMILSGIPEQSVISMIVSEQLGDIIGRFTTTAPVGFAPEAPGGVAPAALPINFAGNLTFLGYDKQDVTSFPGGNVTVITYWRVNDTLPRNLSLFTHMLFDAETIVSQTDAMSVVPARLHGRDVFVQVNIIPIPEDLPPGEYETSIGAYETDGTQRLAILDNGQPRGTRLFLNEISIEATAN